MRKIYILFILLLNVTFSHATGEIIKVTGTVISIDDNEPVIGARVIEKRNFHNQTTTDIDGNFSLSVEKGDTLVFSWVSFKENIILKEFLVDSDAPLRVEVHFPEIDGEIISCPHSTTRIIRIISKDSLDFVLPEDEFLRAQQAIESLSGDYYKLLDVEVGRIKYLLNQEIEKRKNNVTIYGTPAMELSNYARQYFGFRHNGHRLVFINLTSLICWKDLSDFDKHLKTLIIRDAPQVGVRAIIDLDTEGLVLFTLAY